MGQVFSHTTNSNFQTNSRDTTYLMKTSTPIHSSASRFRPSASILVVTSTLLA